MNQAFGSTYAHAYDLLYLDKDYTAECDFIENIFHRYGDKPISRVLDLGCGTGNHAFPLASRGYEVVGIERSESMLAQASNKLAHASTKLKLSYRAGDIDVVWINGYGFPRVKGGPMHMANVVGLPRIKARLDYYAAARGNAHGYWTAAKLLSGSER